MMNCDLEVEAERNSLSSVIGKQARKPDNLRLDTESPKFPPTAVGLGYQYGLQASST